MGSAAAAAGLMALMVICCGIGAASAAVYTVGESSGWSMGSDYSTWSSDKSFQVGDTLVFNYAYGHNVEEVNENDYKSCSSSNAITSDSSGPTSITLKTAGPHYFICGIPGHCDGGMKVAVTAAAAAAAPPTDEGTKTSPSGTTTSPPSTTTTTTSPTPPSMVTGPTKGAATEQPSSSTKFAPSAAVFFAFSIAVLKYFIV